MNSGRNSVPCGWGESYHDREDEMRTYDECPPALRRELRRAAFKLSAIDAVEIAGEGRRWGLAVDSVRYSDEQLRENHWEELRTGTGAFAPAGGGA